MLDARRGLGLGVRVHRSITARYQNIGARKLFRRSHPKLSVTSRVRADCERQASCQRQSADAVLFASCFL